MQGGDDRQSSPSSERNRWLRLTDKIRVKVWLGLLVAAISAPLWRGKTTWRVSLFLFLLANEHLADPVQPRPAKYVYGTPVKKITVPRGLRRSRSGKLVPFVAL